MRIAEEKTQDELPANLEMASRLKEFRQLFVDKNQVQAAKTLKFNQGWLSMIERAHRPIPFKLIDILSTKYNLNVQWLSTGKGEKQIKRSKPGKVSDPERELLEGLEMLKSYITSLEATFGATMNLVKRHEDSIAKLEARVSKLEEKNDRK